ncbi:cation/multidrug efflux pump [Thiorhodovibrio frisius]|uniref:Cation/multidrug efflux pump n=2 Tax=Thiorhodovibrio frisius TaxID=631362 RepID=H8Z581_9GAMM|nr:efflux RND transporter permease subunit [Thiorhodovibrio frisius]EIC20488.1 cation/multidrug efflux pump [Thiorhodovibrio frisius]WPL21229.1 Toluene efflux pump membrane transporter TtgB [Thiorhodovibrio frisius]
MSASGQDAPKGQGAPMGHKSDLIGLFAHHKVAANLLMVIMLMTGIFAIDRLNVQFFPSFDLDIITVRVVWTGASAEDIEDGITNPLEQRLRTLDNLDKMTSTSSQGLSSITLEFKEGTDPLLALDQVRRFVDEFRNFPQDAQKPEVALVTRYEQVARLLITGPDSPAELRQLARRFETELIDRGIDKVDINGLPEEEISIEIDSAQLEELDLGLAQIGDRVAAFSRDLPAGAIGRGEGARELRSLDKRRDPLEFANVPVVTEADLRVNLGDIAEVERRPRDGSVELSYREQPAVELIVQRAEAGDSLAAAKVFDQWLQDARASLTPGVELQAYDQSWTLIRDRIMLLVNNGLGGLILVVAILYLFLTGRVAFWVAWGIPVSFAATLFIMLLTGGSINMISMLALIMALGIIVDDAIVVGEDALAHYQMGEDPLLAAEGGARRMMAPVVASSLTTIASFLPLMLVGGRIGNILIAIPSVIIAVIIASLVESFLVLPGHLRHAFVHSHKMKPNSIRAHLDRAFDRFRDQVFRPIATFSIHHRFATIASALALLILAIGLVAGGRISFTFFPTPEPQVIYANATFAAGTPRETVDRFLNHLEEQLYQAEQSLDAGRLINLAVTYHGTKAGPGARAAADQLGAIQVELLPPDEREVRNPEFIRAWRKHLDMPAGLEHLTITSRRVGPPGRDLTIRLTGNNPEQLKSAALDLSETLSGVPGVLEVEDDMAYGREQLVYSLTPAGEALGLTVADLGNQLRTAYDGRLVQIFQDGSDEVEVRVRLPAVERDSLVSLYRLNIRTPDGQSVPLTAVADWRARQGFEVLRHAEGKLAVEVTADVNTESANTDLVVAALEEGTLPELARTHGISYSFEGRSADQRETLGDMRKGALLGLMLIYIILAWVFASYGWPLVVMTAIPFGISGAFFGHWIMGMDLTILSLFGMFGLSGIVVNDSIILVSFYQRLRAEGMAVTEALIEASCQRLRAVLLTSLTTIAGLTPLLFEHSYQAQFLIPMATSIAFGLAFSTLLVLLGIPALLSLHESIHHGLIRLREQWNARLA